MVSDKVIIVSNGSKSLNLSELPYTVNYTSGFDCLDVKIVTSQGFDQDGETFMNSYVESRPMEIAGQIKAHTTQQMQRLHDNIMNLFVPNKELTINQYYGGSNRLITARVEKTPEFKKTDVSILENYNVRLYATEPYWRDPIDTLIQIANLKGGLHFPLRIPKDKGVTFGVKSPTLIVNAYNDSSIKVGMRIDFIANGTVVNPQLFNVRTREYIKFLCTMEPGEKITVQTGDDKTVTRNMQGLKSDYIGKIDLAGGGHTFLELSPGDNLLRYGAESGEDMLEVKINYRNKYVGV